LWTQFLATQSSNGLRAAAQFNWTRNKTELVTTTYAIDGPKSCWINFLGEEVFAVNLVVHLFETGQLALIQQIGVVAEFLHKKNVTFKNS
jgi:hypothetical protein